MGTPNFAQTARTGFSAATAGDVRLASHKQVEFIAALIAERDWRNDKPSWVSRTAVINATLFIAREAATDDRIVDQLDIALFDRHDVTGTFHQLMSFAWDSAVNDERDPAMSKPLTVAGASAMIDWLRSLPMTAKAVEATEERNVAAAKASVAADRPVISAVVPAGRYAIETEDGAINGLAFYKVDRPETGKWAGRVFVKLMVSDEEQRLSQKQGLAIIAKIARVGAEAASARYGHEIGACGVCARTLTNDESRARGIGPVCAAKLGW